MSYLYRIHSAFQPYISKKQNKNKPPVQDPLPRNLQPEMWTVRLRRAKGKNEECEEVQLNLSFVSFGDESYTSIAVKVGFEVKFLGRESGDVQVLWEEVPDRVGEKGVIRIILRAS